MKYLFLAFTLAAAVLSSFVYSNEPRTQQTLSMIKPDAVAANHIGEIIARFEKAGLHIAGIKMVYLSKEDAQRFYAVHKERPFFAALIEFMSSGPSVAIILEGPDAITKNREIMNGIRADFGQSPTKNAVHGSDAPETAKEELSFFFQPQEVCKR